MNDLQNAILDAPTYYLDSFMEVPVDRQFLHGAVSVFSTRSPAKLSSNEDAAAIVPYDERTGVLVVADGMGGHASGELAARLAVESVVHAVVENRNSGLLLRSAIINGFELANAKVQSIGNGAGTTLAVVEISEEQVRPYHCGDSIILVTGQRGKIKLTTTSHSPVGYGVEAGLLEPSAAMHHEDRHLILNAIGSTNMRIEIGSALKLAARDTVVLASDGLTDNLQVDEIVQVMRKGALARSIQSIATICRDRMNGSSGLLSKPDDLTIVAFRRN
ncbi:MAG: serine/threonine-protein phosphatase [Planctomycetales bacterium]|nr:serine/threonine-protein phosphatase [Planctomycetales bacterium]